MSAWSATFGERNNPLMHVRYTAVPVLFFLLIASPLRAQLTILTQFDPSNTGGTCGIAYNAPAGEIMVIGCSASVIDRYTEEGTFISSADVVGEAANDVDIDMSPADLTMNGTFVAQGQLLLVNGETGAADIYAIDEATNQVIDTLVAGFGVSHVVGGSYHPQRGTFFLVQDNVPGAFDGNRIAEIDATTGDTLQSFSVVPEFDVYYGDLDISPISGNLFVVSSAETTIAEFTPEGVFVMEHPLPSGVSSLSGIALDNDLEGAWVCSTGGVVFKLGNFPVSVPEMVSTKISAVFPNPADDRVTFTGKVPAAGTMIAVRDVSGRVVMTMPMTTPFEGFEVSSLVAGIYTINIVGQTGEEIRFVKR